METGRFVVLGHDTAARCERGLDPGFHRQAARPGLSSKKTGSQHHAGVGSVGARGDGGDDHVTVVQVEGLLVHLNNGPVGERFGRQTVPLMTHFVRQTVHKMALHVLQVNAILWPLGTRQGRHHIVEVQRQHGRVRLLGLVAVVPKALSLGVSFHTGHVSVFPSRQAQVLQRPFVHGEKPAGGTVFGRHVGNGGTVGEGEDFHPRTKEFYKLTNDTVLPQHFHDSQCHVGGGYAGLQFARQAHTNHIGSEHVDGLTEHHGLGFNPADTPTEHAQPVDHRGVRIGSHERVGQPNVVLLSGHAGEELEVHLMDNAARGRNGLEVGQRLLTPLEERVPLHVAVVLNVEVEVEGIGMCTAHVNLHGMVDHKVNGHLGIDLFRVATHFNHGVTERS